MSNELINIYIIITFPVYSNYFILKIKYKTNYHLITIYILTTISEILSPYKINIFFM